MKPYLTRRAVTQGFGAVVLTTSVPAPIPRSARAVTVVCVCEHAGRQWVVFDDQPTTIFCFDREFDHNFMAGQQYLA